MGHTIEGAGEGEAGVVGNLPSPTLHIQWVHGEHMLGRKKTQLQVINSSRWSLRRDLSTGC